MEAAGLFGIVVRLILLTIGVDAVVLKQKSYFPVEFDAKFIL